MSRRPNVHFLGGRPAERLGEYIQHFDVCTMPYVVDDYTKYIYPGKMHEYLASGNPVVSAPVRSVQEFKGVIEVAGDAEEWSKAIERSLTEQENTEIDALPGKPWPANMIGTDWLARSLLSSPNALIFRHPTTPVGSRWFATRRFRPPFAKRTGRPQAAGGG